MIVFDISLVYQLINFIALIFLLNLVLFRPIRKVLIQRKEKISGLEDNISSLGEEAQAQDEAFKVGIRDARTKGLKEKETLVQAAAEEEKEILDKINAEAQADLAEVKAKIAKDVEGVRASLAKEIDGFAQAIGQKILGRTS